MMIHMIEQNVNLNLYQHRTSHILLYCQYGDPTGRITMDSMHIGARDGKRLNSNTLGGNRLKEMYLKVRMQIQGDYKEQYRHTFLCLCV